MRSLLLLVAVVVGLVAGVAGDAEAQLLRRWRSQSSCPGGVCPTGNVTRQGSGHWTYPGTINGHLQTGHGVSTAGMSREAMLNLHDALHEGRSVAAPVVSPMRAPVAAPVIYTAPMSSPAPVVAPVRSIVVPASNDQTFGLSAMLDARPIDLPKHVLGQVAPPEVVVKPAEADTGFRRELAKAIQSARKAGKIDGKTAVRLRAAILSPAFQEEAKQLAVTQMAFSGEVSDHVPLDPEGAIEADGIDWEGLAKFLEAFIPLLLQLLNAFGR